MLETMDFQEFADTIAFADTRDRDIPIKMIGYRVLWILIIKNMA
jgi:hypothetical protein